MTGPSTADVRAWARSNGHTVSDRGRIPAAVQAAYDAAHAPVPPPAYGQVPPPAYGQVPPPAYGQPPPGWGPPPTAPWPRHDTGTDGFAIAALVLGILPLCAGVLGIVFGIIALNRIAGTAKSGRRLAIAGIVCGSLWVIGVIAAIALGVASEPERAIDGAVSSAGDVPATDVRVGDCLSAVPEGDLRTVHVVPCLQPHAAEAVASFDLPDGPFPGEDQVTRLAGGGCERRAVTFLGASPKHFQIYFLVPTTGTWIAGSRSVTCLLGGADGEKLTGPIGRAS